MLYEELETAARTDGRNTADDVLWFNDLPTDDPALASDPQSGDVTDGSVDYFDFNWSEQVAHDEAEMEPVLFSCGQVCSGGCHGGNDGSDCECGDCDCGCDCDDCYCDGCNCDDSSCDDGDCDCDDGGDCDGGGGSDCADNAPEQTDTGEYLILDE